MIPVNRLSLDNLRGDLAGGVQAAVVALPIALAFGVISGAGAMAGFYSAIAVGLFAALFGGTPAQISGPTGPTAVVMAAVLTHYAGHPAQAFTVVMLAGAFQITFGLLRLGRYVNLMPYPVISGWMSGIGTVIILLQLGPALGFEATTSPREALLGLPTHLAGLDARAGVITVICLGLCFLRPGKATLFLPPALLALAAGILLGRLLPGVATLPEPGSLLPSLQWPEWAVPDLRDMLFAGVTIALLGAIDSLLASLAADTATNTLHNSDRELVGQGLGNLAAGLVGGIPGAGATLRTMTNVRNGGRTPLSGVIHSAMLVLMVAGLGFAIPLIPTAALAAVLIRIAIAIIDWRYLSRARTAPRTGLALMFTVLALTVAVNLLVAVAVGIVMASLVLVKRMADLQLKSVRTIDNPAGETSLPPGEAALMRRMAGRVLLVQLSGPMSFGAASGLHARLSGYQDYDVIILDLTAVPYLDSSAAMALETIIVNARSEDHVVEMVGLSLPVVRVLARLGVLRLVREVERHADRLSALRHAATRLGLDPDETGEETHPAA